MDCIVSSYKRCIICDLLGTCPLGKLTIKHGVTQDRAPDALTNDFIYCRGEFDSFVEISKIEIKRCSNAFRAKVEQLRKEVGL